MRQLLATIILGSSLTAMVPVAFAENHGDQSAPAFGAVTVEAVDIEAGLAGTDTPQNSIHEYRLDNIGQ